MSHRRLRHSSPFPLCFRPTTHKEEVPQLRIPTHPNLTTSLYRTDLGLFGLTWSRDLFSRSLHIHIHLRLHQTNYQEEEDVVSFPTQSTKPSFHLQIRPFAFWKKRGSQRLLLPNPNVNDCTTNKNMPTADVYWDLSRAKFGSRPDPSSGFYVAILIDGEMTLLVGDFQKEAYANARTTGVVGSSRLIRPPPMKVKQQVMFLRREHVYGNKLMLYTTKADLGGGGERDVSIDCRLGVDDPRLYISIDHKRVLQIKHLKWKFRGNERIHVDGIPIQVSWDVHNWLFRKDDDVEVDGYALFMFKFEKPPGLNIGGFQQEEQEGNLMFSSNSSHHNQQQTCGFGFETKKMKKGLTMLRSGRSSYSSSSSSSSLCSASSGCSSVMEWESVEENELKDPCGFSLLVYAWKN